MKKEKGKNLFPDASKTIENSEKAVEKLFQAIERAERIVDDLIQSMKKMKKASSGRDAQ